MCSTVDDGILPKKIWGMVVSPPAIPPPWSLGCLNILGAVSCKIIFTKEKDKQFCVRLEKCWISENIQKQFSRVNTQLRVFPLIKQILVIFDFLLWSENANSGSFVFRYFDLSHKLDVRHSGCLNFCHFQFSQCPTIWKFGNGDFSKIKCKIIPRKKMNNS